MSDKYYTEIDLEFGTVTWRDKHPGNIAIIKHFNRETFEFSAEAYGNTTELEVTRHDLLNLSLAIAKILVETDDE